MSSGKYRKYTLRIIRLLAWLFASLFLIFLMVLLILQFTAVQTWLTGKIASRLSEETGAVIKVERVAIRFPKSVGLKGIYIEEPGGDTLLHAGSIYTDVRMTALLRNRIHINSLEVEDLTGFITREESDTVFNFQFLADAFTGNKENDALLNNCRPAQGNAQAEKREDSPPAEKDNRPREEDSLTRKVENERMVEEEDRHIPGEESSPLSILLRKVKLKNISIRFEDHFSGTRLITHLDYLQTRLDDADLLNGKYHAGKTEIAGSNVQLFTREPSLPADETDPGAPEIEISLLSLDITDSEFFLESPDGGQISIETSVLNIIPETISLHDKLVEISSIRTENLNT